MSSRCQVPEFKVAAARVVRQYRISLERLAMLSSRRAELSTDWPPPIYICPVPGLFIEKVVLPLPRHYINLSVIDNRLPYSDTVPGIEPANS